MDKNKRQQKEGKLGMRGQGERCNLKWGGKDMPY